jgi:hypothetical protein
VSRSTLCFILLILAGPALLRAEWPHINAKLKKGGKPVATVVMFPARVSLNRKTLHGPESASDDSGKVSASLFDAIVRELDARGVRILPNPLITSTDDSARYAVSDLQAKYDAVAGPIRKSLGDVDKGRFTLTDKVAAFQPGLEADALVFIRARGKTGLLSPMSAFSDDRASLQCDVGLVDPRSGEVLAFLRFNRTMVKIEDAGNRFDYPIREALREVPFPTPTPKN